MAEAPAVFATRFDAPHSNWTLPVASAPGAVWFRTTRNPPTIRSCLLREQHDTVEALPVWVGEIAGRHRWAKGVDSSG